MKANLPPRPRPRPQPQAPSPIIQSQIQSPSPVSPHPPVEPSPPPQPSIPINPSYHPHPGIDNPIEEDDNPLPTLHLLLLHNFTSSTYLTLTTDSTVAHFWRTSVVNLAFSLSSSSFTSSSSSSSSSSYLLRVLLSVSALHLAFQQSCPQKRDFYTAQGILLHQKATREAMRKMLPVIEREEDELGLYLFAALTIYVALASPRGKRGDGRVYVLENQGEWRRNEEMTLLDDRGDKEVEAAGLPGMETGSAGLNFPDWAFLVNGPKSLSNFITNNAAHQEFLKPFLAYGGRRWREARGESSSSSSTSPSAGLSKTGTPTPSGTGIATGSGSESSSDMPVEQERDENENENENENKKEIPRPRPLSHLRSLISSDTTNPHLETYLFAIDELELSLTHLTSSSPTANTNTNTDTIIITSPSITPSSSNYGPDSDPSLSPFPSQTTTQTEAQTAASASTASGGGDVLDAMLWLWAVSDSLVPLLKIPTQEAVAVFAHFGILLKHHERQWWLQGWGDHLILRAKDILDEKHRGWISWPLEVLEGGQGG